MRCTRCGGKDFGRLDLRMSGPSGPFSRTVFKCNRCGKPRAAFLNDPEFEEVGLTSLLKSQIERSSDQDPDKGAAFRLATGAFVYEVFKDLRKLPPGPDRARRTHRDIDEAIKDHHDGAPKEAAQISCRAGCSACCFTAVGVTQDEAELLAERVAGGVEIDMELLQRQQEPARDDKAWFTDEIKHADRRCVFLSPEGKCRVYEDRPAACRKYFVTSDPKFCDLEKHPKHGVWNLVTHTAECITSAGYSIDKAVNFLPRALLAALKKLAGGKK